MPAHKSFEGITFLVNGSRVNHITKGIIRITAKELIYADDEQQGDWVWPLIHIEMYDYYGSRFSFEAGKLCPGGEKTYTFYMEEAEQLFDIVECNIGILKRNRATLP